jgi:predicted nucleic acid-binding protein
MAFVLDASVTACWAFDDEDHPDASRAFERMQAEEGVVPGLWWFEVRNILIVNERRRRIAESDTAAFLLDLPLLRLRADQSPEENAILRLARAHRLSVYDAAYLELARREGLPLATLAGDLRKAAASEGVALVTHGSETLSRFRRGMRCEWLTSFSRKPTARAPNPYFA